MAHELLWIPAADHLTVQKTGLVDLADDHSDLVAMTSEHEPNRSLDMLGRDQVAVQVDPHLVCQVGDILPNPPLDQLFVARGTGVARRSFRNCSEASFIAMLLKNRSKNNTAFPVAAHGKKKESGPFLPEQPARLLKRTKGA